ncbi:hypothetical protein A3A78_00685 [candidate division WWE3 bacterium RIFCSPLOWO2_01_FULL_41_18]|uniref:Uncharacterized protein n=1 Tax=candidate division WWE3 bacterium RIFCSPLOWO2_01_FULL_41_18 TaxID=1802625 RepID=A0A1F4VE62_UNCKA|nr:MAG: hypothetical protein A3A78_00685 [candidate division WWE3 bacterium RIFCSPLOWO2_01_FULL_41_18]
MEFSARPFFCMLGIGAWALISMDLIAFFAMNMNAVSLPAWVNPMAMSIVVGYVAGALVSLMYDLLYRLAPVPA